VLGTRVPMICPGWRCRRLTVQGYIALKDRLTVQGYLAHKKTPTPLVPPRTLDRRTVGSYGVEFSYV